MNRRSTNWKKILPSLEGLSKHQLIELINDLNDTCPEVSLFLGGRFGKTEISLKPYIAEVKTAASANLMYGEGINWKAADRAIHNYRVASGDNKGVAELLILYVHTANQFTLQYGDVDEEYYETMEELFQDTVDHLLFMKKENKPIDEYVMKLKGIVDSARDTGWGYYDSLCDMYCKAFNK